MFLEKTVEGVRRVVQAWKGQGLTIGLVPTMGFLHEGHASLIRRAVAECDRAVVSIFVNPAQFGPHEDLATYPRDLERDADLCRSLGADLVFHPEPDAMYPSGFATFVEVEGLSDTLCGRSRPGHFRGVCTVVCKLFALVRPDKGYFGRKDAQQLAIIRRMTEDLHLDVDVIPCPIVREPDGLALSSRNAYLSPAERAASPVLHRALRAGQAAMENGGRSVSAVVETIREVLRTEPLAVVDYVDIVDAATLRPVDHITGEVLAALAVRVGSTRLIDNISFNPEEAS